MNDITQRPYKALLCLKNEQICKPIHQFFTQEKAERVVYAHNNRDAIQRMSEYEFNFFIIGSEFPSLGGIDFSRFIRLGDGKMAEAPIMMFMQDPNQKKVLAAINAGINEIIVPPFTITTLNNRMKHIIKKPRPFVRTDSYSGPARSGTDDLNYLAA